ncbi:MAG: hypothetical protein ABII71_03920, partial [Candidatus Micrarchaeota archaeon]
ESKPAPELIALSYECNVSAFTDEYNLSGPYQSAIVYNEVPYRVLHDNKNDLYLAIDDASCTMQTDKSVVEEVLTLNSLSSSLSDYDEHLYRDLAICYGVSAGARPICALTSGTKDINEQPLVEAASAHERETLSIVNRLAPNGWKTETVGATRGVIRLTKQLKGPGFVAEAFEVADTTSCYLKDSIAVSIYDYSLTVGDDIWYRLKNRNSFTGADQDLYEVNLGLQGLMAHPDAPSVISNLAGSALGGKDCWNAKESYGSQMNSINEKIDYSRSSGKDKAVRFSLWVTPIRVHAEAFRQESLNKSNTEAVFSFDGMIRGILVLTKLPDYLEAKGHYDTAEDYFKRGLFHSSEKEYSDLSDSLETWRAMTIWDYILSSVFWLVVLGICIIFIVSIWPSSY